MMDYKEQFDDLKIPIQFAKDTKKEEKISKNSYTLQNMLLSPTYLQLTPRMKELYDYSSNLIRLKQAYKEQVEEAEEKGVSRDERKEKVHMRLKKKLLKKQHNITK